MLKTRDLHEVPELFQLLISPKVFPFVRHKAATSDEYYFITKKTIEEESNGSLISRTILDEYEHPIGTINLFDIKNNYGFLATWIGEPYFGKGYNKLAKELFLNELFFDNDTIQTVFMKVRRTNTRSAKAALKLPFVVNGKELFPDIYFAINQIEDVYDLFVIPKELYISCTQFIQESAASVDGEEAS
ncbi:GNAT family N-acetyltransferase [Virgibacillus sp. W0430]|uniref:GNAT family N-acetyltransferase n=1 Tax=Virgibacillus sp. W0430 TaxID=3391580 RepID=UPI003F482A1A